MKKARRLPGLSIGPTRRLAALVVAKIFEVGIHDVVVDTARAFFFGFGFATFGLRLGSAL